MPLWFHGAHLDEKDRNVSIRERLEDARQMALNTEKEVMSQGIRVGSRS